jgi:glutaconyl-CoA/methylmalonyl-CoA decarboxylase subunit delta
MKILGYVFYMYAIAAAISFFVAFLINLIFVSIRLVEKQRIAFLKNRVLPEGIDVVTVQREAESMEKEGEVYAAIAMALYLYNKEINESENLKITIQKSMKPYSPWSSKIYGLNQWRR